jgi:hypothetical protein
MANEIGGESLDLNDQCILLELAQDILADASGRSSTAHEDTLVPGYEFPSKATTAGQPLTNIQDQDIDPQTAKKLIGSRAVHDTNYNYIKYISLRAPTRKFLEITAPQVAQLAPAIKIDVAYYDKMGKFEHAVPLDFPNHTDLNGLLSAQGQRYGAGIKEITIVHEGIDSATDKIVLIDSVFVFQDFRTLAQSNYQNLISLGIKSTSNLLRYLRFQFGWDSNPRVSGDLGLPQLRSEVRAELVKYTFDFAEDGSIILKTQHRGHIHSMFGNLPAANILGTMKNQESKLREQSVDFIESAMNTIREQNTVNQKELALRKLALSVVMDTMSKYDTLHQATGGMDEWTSDAGLQEAGPGALNDWQEKRGAWLGAGTDAGELASAAGLTATGDDQAWLQIIERGYREGRNADGSLPDQGMGRLSARTRLAFWVETSHLTDAVVENALSARLGTPPGDPLPAIAQANIQTIRDHARTFLRHARRRALDSGGGKEDIVQTWLERDDRAGHPITSEQVARDWRARFLVSWKGYLGMQSDFQTQLENLSVATDQTTANLQPRSVLATARKQLAHKMGLIRFLSLFNLARTLRDNQKIYFGALTEAQTVSIAGAKTSAQSLTNVFSTIKVGDFLRNISKISPSNPAFIDDWTDKAKENLSTPLISSMPFVFLGEFLSTILEVPSDLGGSSAETMPMWELLREQAGIDLRVVLGYTDFEAPFTGRIVKNFPLYYLPISLRKLNNFIAREVVGRDKTFYSFGAFLKDIINKFIDVHFHVCSKVANAGYIPSTPKLDFAFGETPRGETIWFIYDSKQTGNVFHNKQFGKYGVNMANKIPHFYLGGPDKGIAKKVQIRDIADPSLKTAVFYKTSPSDTLDPGNAGPAQGRWAPVVFEAEVDTLGYPKFQLGHMIFVDATTIIPKTARKNFLATGYYGIKKITHTLTPDDFSTTVNAIIQVSEADKDKTQSTGTPSHAPGAKPIPNATETDVLVVTSRPLGLPRPAPGTTVSVKGSREAQELANKAAASAGADLKKKAKLAKTGGVLP